MTHHEAVEFLRPALGKPDAAAWADFGAGGGTFTEALAELLGAGGTVLAIDSDPTAVRALGRLVPRAPDAARIQAIAGDVRDMASIEVLVPGSLAGALFANVLHFVPRAELVLAQVRRYLRPDARIVVIEDDRRAASPWVPYPLPLQALAVAARAAGLGEPVETGRRPSQFQGELYCARILAGGGGT